MNCDVGGATEVLEKAVTSVKRRKGWRMSFDVGEVRKGWRLSRAQAN